MLEPDTRELLLDALRPPDDCELVHALGTTYSLDLQALLFAPLAFALFDWAIEDDGRPNPIALLEALRRHADRTTLFCQAGQVGLPPEYQPLFVHLESSGVPVTAPDPDFIFHPKLWVLRFRPNDGGADRYRLLCLTRNLTFDTSWDTVLTLDGTRRAGGHTESQNEPLVDFIRGLLDRAPRLDDRRQDAIEDLADDIRNVRFDAPEGFDSVRFHPLGLADRGWPFRGDVTRMLVISPFLTTQSLQRLAGVGEDHVLVSRQESLDELGRQAVGGFEGVFVLADAAVQPDVLDSDDPGQETQRRTVPLTDEVRGDAVDAELHGLHAKLFVAEHPTDIRYYTGSANATTAAFGGNVEFLVELRTRQAGHGIDDLLAFQDGVTTLRDLLQNHLPDDIEREGPGDAEIVDRSLDIARRRIGALDLVATLEADGDAYLLDLDAAEPIDLPDEVTALHCWRISAGQGHQISPRWGRDGLHASFGHVPEAGITSFFAFEVTGERGQARDRLRFVANARLVGAPEGRADAVISQILRDRQDVLRYLLFLLADTSGGFTDLMEQLGAIGGGQWRDRQGGGFEPPVFETLLRSLARDPSRLDRIAGLLDDLRRSGRADELVPPELEQLWEPVWEVRQEVRP